MWFLFQHLSLYCTYINVCLCVCHLTGFSSNSSAQCRAVTAHSTVVARATRIRKNNMKQFKKHVSEQKAREWKRLSHFLHHLSCNWRLSSPPVGASRDEVNRVHVEAKSSRTTCDKRSVTSIITRSAIGAKIKELSKILICYIYNSKLIIVSLENI